MLSKIKKIDWLKTILALKKIRMGMDENYLETIELKLQIAKMEPSA
jgi:hypothetical protein